MLVYLKARARGGSSEKRGSDPAPIPTFSPATREAIQRIFDRAARRKLREEQADQESKP